MSQTTTLFRFQINFSDIDRSIYKNFDLRLAQHPSENNSYLLTRLIAYCLNEEEFLAFSDGGLSDPESPALWAKSPNGEIYLWIEIGNPSAKKLHKASKAANRVLVYTYKDPKPLIKEMIENKVYEAENIPVYSLDAKFLEKVAEKLDRKNSWEILVHEGMLNITIGEFTVATEIVKSQVEKS